MLDYISHKAFLSLQRVIHNKCICCKRICSLPICKLCIRKIEKPDFFCCICGLEIKTEAINKICNNCLLKPPPYEKINYIGNYDGILSDLIIKAKLSKSLSAITALLSILKSDSNLYDYEGYSILAMPITKIRLMQRGFNLPLIFAKSLSDIHSIPIISQYSVLFSSNNKKQAKLDFKQRQRNKHRYNVKICLPSKIIIVDDVVTSGATIFDLAKILRINGVKSVVVWSIARSQWKKSI